MLDIIKYSYFHGSSSFDYNFESVGYRGLIKKVARFDYLGSGIYNFGFGDINNETGRISDVSISNNGDSEKIMGTVASIIFDFTNAYPNAAIFIKGSTRSRTRLYQINLGKYIGEIQVYFEVFAFGKYGWEAFKRGNNYEAFLGRRKKILL